MNTGELSAVGPGRRQSRFGRVEAEPVFARVWPRRRRGAPRISPGGGSTELGRGASHPRRRFGNGRGRRSDADTRSELRNWPVSGASPGRPVEEMVQQENCQETEFATARSAWCSIETSPVFVGWLRCAALVQRRMRVQICDGRPRTHARFDRAVRRPRASLG
jgi:hypothetical protein